MGTWPRGGSRDPAEDDGEQPPLSGSSTEQLSVSGVTPPRWAKPAVAAGAILIVTASSGLVLTVQRSPSRPSESYLPTEGPRQLHPAVPPSTGPLRVGLPAPESPATGERDKGDRQSFYLRAAGQTGDGKTVLVKEVVLVGRRGWVAVHATAGAVPGEVIGVSPLLPPGGSADIVVPLTAPLPLPAAVFTMVHLDDNNSTTWDFPAADAPVRLGDGSTLSFPIQVEVR